MVRLVTSAGTPSHSRDRRDQPAVLVRRRVEGGHVHPLQPGQRAQQRTALALGGRRRRQPGAQHLVDLAHDLLTVAQDEGVDEVGQRLGVEGAVAAGHDERVGAAAVRRVQGEAGQVDQVQDVRVDQLGREVEGQHVEGGGGQVLLDAEERHAGRPHGGLHVDPGGVGPLGQRVGTLVEDLVEDLQTLVGQADLVGVGVDQQPGHPARARARGTRAPAHRRCSGRAWTRGQQALDLRPEGLHPPQPYDAGGAHPPAMDVVVVGGGGRGAGRARRRRGGGRRPQRRVGSRRGLAGRAGRRGRLHGGADRGWRRGSRRCCAPTGRRRRRRSHPGRSRRARGTAGWGWGRRPRTSCWAPPRPGSTRCPSCPPGSTRPGSPGRPRRPSRAGWR